MDTSKLDAVALALVMLEFDKLHAEDVRYVLDKAGFVVPIIIDHESFKYRVSSHISRWPTEVELRIVRKKMINMSAANLVEAITKEACSHIRRG